MRIVPDVGRKAARARTPSTRTRLGYSRKLSLARSLACHRKVDNVARVPIVIGLPGGASSVARARVCLGFTESLSPPTRSRTPFSRRSAEGLLGVETITPYTCSGLMVREYYIRIWNTPDNKGRESTVVVWHWYGKSRSATGNGGWGMGDEGATESTVIYRARWNRWKRWSCWNLTSRYITSYNIL